VLYHIIAVYVKDGLSIVGRCDVSLVFFVHIQLVAGLLLVMLGWLTLIALENEAIVHH
jgi:hypothetical protein